MKKLPKRFTDVLELECRWPTKGDRLLRSSDNWSSAVTFSQDPISKHADLWRGYMRAGAGLIELCGQEGYEHERHFAIYPILFNYRQGLELAMKWIIVMYGAKSIRGVGPTHNLRKLWERCREIMDEYGNEENEVDQAVELIVQEFHELDKDGIIFRYGWSNDGKEIKLPEHMIDLENIRDVMDGVDGFFSGLDGWLRDLSAAAN